LITEYIELGNKLEEQKFELKELKVKFDAKLEVQDYHKLLNRTEDLESLLEYFHKEAVMRETYCKRLNL